MFLTSVYKVLICLAVIILFDVAQSNPIEQVANVELSDLNVAAGKAQSLQNPKFVHRDEDSPQLGKVTQAPESGPNDEVEMLEVRDVKKENIEIEERFRGPALQFGTNTFADESIEVNEIKDDNQGTIKESHLLLNISIVCLGLTSVGIYVGLVMWRMHLEKRYGTRELLVNVLDDDYLDNYHRECNSEDNNSDDNTNRSVRVSSN